MIDIGTRVFVAHRSLYGRVIKRTVVPNAGVMYLLEVETADGSHCQALYGSSSVNIAVNQRPFNAAGVVAMPKRPALRLAACNGVAL